MPTIYVSRNGNSYQLKLKDSEGHDPGNDNLTTDVNAGDVVTWQLADNSGLSSIYAIEQVTSADQSFNPNGINLLNNVNRGVDGSFSATVVSPSPGRGKFENYKIGFTVPNDSTVYWDDPKLQMNN